MNPDWPNSLQLFGEQLPGVNYADLYRATWLQVQKDFEHCCEVPVLEDVPTPKAMLDAIDDMLALLSAQPHQLHQLFYRVDLSEKQKIPHGDSRALALMILRREAQKVWIRMHYSGPSS